MSDIAITFAIIAALVVLFVWGRLPVEIVALGAALALWATGILTLEQTLAGFGDPVVIFIASLFVVSEALEATGVTAWAGQQLIDRAGASRSRLVVLMMLVVAALTAVVTVNAAVAALLPVVVVAANRLSLSPSKLLIPLCFGAHAGSQLALTGSNVNMLIADAALQYDGTPIGFFEFAIAGVPLLIGTIAIVTLLGDRLLPVRSPRTISVGPQPARADPRPSVRARAGRRRGERGFRPRARAPRDRDPAALVVRRRARVPGHGVGARRPRRGGDPAARHGPGGRGGRARGWRRPAASRIVGGARGARGRPGPSGRRPSGSRPPSGGAPRASGQGGDRSPGGDGRPARDGPGAARGGRTPRRGNARGAPGRVDGAGVPRDHLDDRRPRRGDAAAVDGDVRDRRGGPRRGGVDRGRRGPRPVRACSPACSSWPRSSGS